MAMHTKKALRLIDRGWSAMRKAGLEEEVSGSGIDVDGPYIAARESLKAREVLQPLMARGLRVQWGETWLELH